ncbi:MAG: hypothetical protein IT314_11435 [Anaerolineales bacterium]|nr:hypothetical protein [Anaerolineales bacterium]
MIFARKILPALLFVSIALAACGGQPATEPASDFDLNAILTSSIGTVSASFFETQTALVTPASPTSTSTTQPTDTAIALVSPTASTTQAFISPPLSAFSLTPSVTGTQFTPTVNAASLALGCNNLFLIRDETIPAGTVMKPKETFTKTWKVENNGTCDWVFQYRLVFISGNQMDGEPAGLGKVIPPQKWTQISIGLTAPKQPGTYTGTWRLGTQAGNAFGSTLTVSIVVANPTNTPLPPTNTAVPLTSTNTPSPTSPAPTETPTQTQPPTETPTITLTP